MQNINKDFDIPIYIMEEIINYYTTGKRISVLENLKSLLGLAKVNKRLTQNQVNLIIKMVEKNETI